MKKIYEKQFTKEHLLECDKIRQIANKTFNLNSHNALCLIFQKIKELHKVEGDFIECGTWRGNTLIPTAMYSKETGYFLNKKLIGVDTFKGFPPTKNHHEKDLPSYFNVLYEEGKITKDNLDKAKKRTNNFKDTSFLENEYFSDVGEIFENCKRFDNVSLIPKTFEEALPLINNKIAIVHIDSDLYESYLICLNNLYENIIDGGTIIFDEYYSHKYPGARVAVDEFFEDKSGYFEKYLTSEGHERWCFVKKSMRIG